MWDPWWNPMWDAVAASGLPVHFHTIGSEMRRDFSKLAPKVRRPSIRLHTRKVGG